MADHSVNHPTGGASAVLRDRRLSEWTQVQAEIARLQARANEILAAGLEEALTAVAESARCSQAAEVPLRSMVAEFAASARMSEITLEGLAFDARRLVSALPDTHRALSEGEISLQHAREIAQVPIPADAAPERIAEFECRVLDRAAHTTARRTRVFARALAQKMFPVDPPTRHRRERDGRHVRVNDFEDGMSDLVVHVPTVIARGAHDRLTQFALAVRDAAREQAHAADGEETDDRTLDQVRADVASDLLLAADPATIDAETASAISARVQVTIPVRALAGLSEHGAELDGVGLVEPELIRELAGVAEGWDRLFIDPVTDTVVCTDRYRPTAAMQRFLRARDQHCRFPGCRMPVARCQIDHTEDHARGGPTALGNLSHLCLRHHPLKHPDIPDPYRWKAMQLSNGVIQWESPGGRHYIDEPPPRVAFEDPTPPWAAVA